MPILVQFVLFVQVRVTRLGTLTGPICGDGAAGGAIDIHMYQTTGSGGCRSARCALATPAGDELTCGVESGSDGCRSDGLVSALSKAPTLFSMG